MLCLSASLGWSKNEIIEQREWNTRCFGCVFLKSWSSASNALSLSSSALSFSTRVVLHVVLCGQDYQAGRKGGGAEWRGGGRRQRGGGGGGKHLWSLTCVRLFCLDTNLTTEGAGFVSLPFFMNGHFLQLKQLTALVLTPFFFFSSFKRQFENFCWTSRPLSHNLCLPDISFPFFGLASREKGRRGFSQSFKLDSVNLQSWIIVELVQLFYPGS